MRTVTENSVGLELGHLYAPARAARLEWLADGETQFNPPEIGRLRSSAEALESDLRKLCQLGASPIRRVALLDDVGVREQQRTSADPARWELFTGISRESLAQATGAEVRDESALITRGKELQTAVLERAKARGFTITEGRRIEIPTTSGVIRVTISGFQGVEEKDFPSCAVLDLAWTEERSKRFDRTVTTLPVSYTSQQRKVAALAALIGLPRRESVTTVFLGSSGSPVGELRFAEISLTR